MLWTLLIAFTQDDGHLNFKHVPRSMIRIKMAEFRSFSMSNGPQ